MSVRGLRRGTMAGRGAAPAAGVEYRAASASSQAESDSSPIVTIPAAVVTGDLMLLAVVTLTSGVSAATPSGWTLERTDTGAGSFGGTTIRLYRRIATAGDTGGAATVTVTLTPEVSRHSTTFVAYSNVDSTTPINVAGATGSASDGTTATAPSVTTTADGCMIVECFGWVSAAGATATITGPATVRGASAEAYVGGAVSDQTQASAGATGTKTATAPTGPWVAQTIAVKAA